MFRYKTSKRIIKIMSCLIPGKSYRKSFRAFLDEKFKVEYTKNIEAQQYLKKYNTVANIVLPNNVTVNPSELPIWQLWLQGEDEAPEIVKRCLLSVKKHAGNRKVVLLTEKNLSEFVDIPNFILEKKAKGIISNTHFSDILRICLLEKYGGTWIDATVFLTGPIPDEIQTQQLFAFSVPENHANADFHLFSSWFIHAQPTNPIISSTQSSIFKYWLSEDELIDYFTLHLIIYNVVNSDIELRNQWDKGLLKNNVAPHELQFTFKEKYNIEKLENIKLNSTIHKLTYKIKNDIPDTFLDVFLKKEI